MRVQLTRRKGTFLNLPSMMEERAGSILAISICFQLVWSTLYERGTVVVVLILAVLALDSYTGMGDR